MSYVLYQSDPTATRRRVPFTLVDETDGITPEDIVVTGEKVQYSKLGGAPAASTADIVKVDGPNGQYYIEFTAAEIDTIGGFSFWLKPAGCALSATEVQISPDDIFLSSVKRSNTAQAGASGTITLDVGADANDNFYVRDFIWIVSGTGAGQSRFISSYVGATKVASVTPDFVIAPDNSSKFIIVPFGMVTADVQRISDDAGAADNLEKILDGTGGVTLSAVLGANAIPATAIVDGAITAPKFAAGAIGVTQVSPTLITAITDSILTRDFSAVSGEAARSVLNALRLLRNRKAVNTGTDTITIYKEDGVTPAFVLTYSGTDPVVTAITA